MATLDELAGPHVATSGPPSIPRPAEWKPGTQSTWSLGSPHTMEDTLDRLPPVVDQPDVGGLRESAVLVALAPAGEGLDVLLTQRSAALRFHAGEVSFPGGRVDPGERPITAAIREADEEVGLDPDGVHVFGQLPPHRTNVSDSFIVPVVARVDREVRLVPNPAEVARAFWMPLGRLAEPGVHHSELWPFGDGWLEVHFFEVAPSPAGDAGPPELVWGATAQMLVNLLDRLAGIERATPAVRHDPRTP